MAEQDPVQRSVSELIASLHEQSQTIEQLQEALASRDVISQAKGILMERLKITSDAAFELLSDASSRLNVKVHELSQRLIFEGSVDGYFDTSSTPPSGLS